MHLWDPDEIHVVLVTLQRLQLVALKVDTTHRVVHAFEPRLVGPVEAQALPFGVSVTPLPLRARPRLLGGNVRHGHRFHAPGAVCCRQELNLRSPLAFHFGSHER